MCPVDAFETFSVPHVVRQKGPPRGLIYFTIRHGRDFHPSPGAVDFLNLKRGEHYKVEINRAIGRLRLVQCTSNVAGMVTLHRSGGQLTTGGRARVYTRSRELCAELQIAGYMTHVCRSRAWIENGIKMMEIEYPKENEND